MVNTVIPIPMNLPLLLNDTRPGTGAAIAQVMSGNLDLLHQLDVLNKFWRIKVWFAKDVFLKVPRHWVVNKVEGNVTTKSYITSKTTSYHVFNKKSILYYNDILLYVLRVNARQGYHFPTGYVIKYEPVPEADHGKKDYEFSTYEQFKAKFDPAYITEDEMIKLWNEKSPQTCNRYNKKDFRKISPRGKIAVDRFLLSFRGVTNADPITYKQTSDFFKKEEKYHLLKVYEHATSVVRTARDVTVSHRLGNPYIHYASEYAGTGNGSYGILANKNEYLHTEDD